MAEVTGQAIVLLVRDVRRTLAYYRDRLGFEVESYENPSHYGFAHRGGVWLHFAHWDGVEPRPNSAAVPPDMFDVYAYTDDVRTLHEELVERGAEILHGPVEQPWVALEIRVCDPDGYVVAIGQLR